MSDLPESDLQRELRQDDYANYRDNLQAAANRLRAHTPFDHDIILILDALEAHDLIEDTADYPDGWSYVDTSSDQASDDGEDGPHGDFLADFYDSFNGE